jgi:GT2 family glycosyltransferase
MSSGLGDVSVLVPYRAFGTNRDDAWTHLARPAWEATDAELIVQDPGPGRSPAEFNHPRAINEAARRATRPILMIADADCLWHPVDLPELLAFALDREAPWVLPASYLKLNPRQTRRRLNGQDAPHAGFSLDMPGGKPEWYATGVSWAGLVAIRARDFWSIGGYDERFSWWGADDMAFGLKADTLIGRHYRQPGEVVHLHHLAPLRETYGHERHREQYALSERYRRAAGKPAQMQRLASEAHA